MKTSELTGALLDYWVAKIADYPNTRIISYEMYGEPRTACMVGLAPYRPSSSWEEAGPIIEREKLATGPYDMANAFPVIACGNPGMAFRAYYVIDCYRTSQYGPTPIIAAMRAYVASKFGDEVPDTEA